MTLCSNDTPCYNDAMNIFASDIFVFDPIHGYRTHYNDTSHYYDISAPLTVK